MDANLSKFWDIVKDKKAWHASVQGLQRVGHNWGTELQNLHFFFLGKKEKLKRIWISECLQEELGDADTRRNSVRLEFDLGKFDYSLLVVLDCMWGNIPLCLYLLASIWNLQEI